ncbi:hypothetical protein ETAA8_66750 [Anatilimnocola aggregata]|uniref:Uncharacterized protein n=1 Tax=Anatilimnocola aggregata TaxID=2528021 RepID=A0A517YMR9_9BACT|nr:hypothetical protein [Anatilimnocola aggregata]QDU31516.1 hypothetical protein ETAA8_66750 [Anatilimnocola aggregata]
MIRTFTFVFTVLALATLSSGVAQAQYPYAGDVATWNGWGGYGYGGGWGYLGTRVGFAPQPPYFAIHPPVYYSSQIIRRPYGTSPFAWPATYNPSFGTAPVASQEVAKSDPVFVINPYVQQGEPDNGGGQLPPPK